MQAILGVSLFCGALLVFRLAMIGARLEPQPWWGGEAMQSMVTVPLSVAGIAFGITALAAWAIKGEWRRVTAMQGVGLAAVIVVYLVLVRLLKLWSRRPAAVKVPGAPAAP